MHPRDRHHIEKWSLQSKHVGEKTENELKLLQVEANNCRSNLDRAIAQDDNDAIQKEKQNYRRIKAKMDSKRARTKKIIDELNCKIAKTNYIPTGEREAFIEYSARSGNQNCNSWETVGEMQHHGVPTRLLDWSETLSSALFFALKRYFVRLTEVWRTDKRNGEFSGPLSRSPYDLLQQSRTIDTPKARSVGDLLTPSVWVLNPFKLSEITTGHTRIWDLTRQPEYDYFQKIIVEKEWPFEMPLPMYAPWRIPRPAAQQGTFLAWGRFNRPLTEITKNYSDFVSEVRITENAAMYGVYMLSHVLSVDGFSLFRDLDSLSFVIRDKYIDP
jgi:hypothetical protein